MRRCRCDETEHDRDENQLRGSACQPCDDLDALRAERETDPNLPDPLGNELRERRVQAHHRDQQREPGQRQNRKV